MEGSSGKTTGAKLIGKKYKFQCFTLVLFRFAAKILLDEKPFK